MSTRDHGGRRPSKVAWETPVLAPRGEIGDLLQFPGTGKLSQVADDMGDINRKPAGLEMK